MTIAGLKTAINTDVTSKVATNSITPTNVGGYLEVIGGEAITYATLQTKIGGSTLQQGRTYLITDFATKHYIVDGNGDQDLGTIITGATEGLMVVATSSNTVGGLAKSILYPQDIIHVNFTAAKWETDPSFADITDIDNPVMVTGWKGVITYREDTINNNKARYDFRHCKTRRWAATGDAWDNGTTYAAGDTVIGSDNVVYSSVANGNIAHDPTSTGGEFWCGFWNLDDWDHIMTYPGDTSYGLTEDGDPQDYLTFHMTNGSTYEYSVRNNDMSGVKDDAPNWLAAKTLIPNNVFVLFGGDTFIEINSNRFGMNSAFAYNTMVGMKTDNKWLGDCTFTIVADNHYNNTYLGTSYYNAIFNYFTANTIDTDFQDNRFGDQCSGNRFGTGFSTNICSQYFSGNITGKGCMSNKFSDHFANNIIHGNMSTNRFGRNVQQNTFGDNFSTNLMKKESQFNNFGQNITASTFGENFRGNQCPFQMLICVFPDGTRKCTFMDSIGPADFSAGTIILTTYAKSIFTQSDSNLKLSYVDGAGIFTVVAYNA